MLGIIKKRNIVVGDGTNYRTLNEIIGLVRMYKGRKCEMHVLDNDHPSIKVITFRGMTDESYSHLRMNLEVNYPALCSFNVPL